MTVTVGARMAHALLARLEREGKLDEALRYEILGGELVVREAPHIRHERAVRMLVTHFAVWLDRHGGEALAGAAVEIGEHQLVRDVSFVRPDADGIYHTTEHTCGTLITEHAPGLEAPVAELFATG